jgi:oxygen-dependent protoporphyrinogen oxidase
VVNLIYKREDIDNPLDGFGFVVPASEKRDIIACSFSSVKFQNRAPEGHVTLRVFVGGALKPGATKLSDKEILAMVQRDLRKYLKIKNQPEWYQIARWDKSMPQYCLGHAQLVKELEQQMAQISGAFLAGNAYGGVGIPDCIHSGNVAGISAFTFMSSSAAPANERALSTT